MRIPLFGKKLSARRERSTTTARPTATASTGSEAVSRAISELFDVEPNGIDLLIFGPTTQCLCGNGVLHALVWMDEDTREIGGYFTEMKCAACGSLLRATTPVDEVIA